MLSLMIHLVGRFGAPCADFPGVEARHRDAFPVVFVEFGFPRHGAAFFGVAQLQQELLCVLAAGAREAPGEVPAAPDEHVGRDRRDDRPRRRRRGRACPPGRRSRGSSSRAAGPLPPAGGPPWSWRRRRAGSWTPSGARRRAVSSAFTSSPLCEFRFDHGRAGRRFARRFLVIRERCVVIVVGASGSLLSRRSWKIFSAVDSPNLASSRARKFGVGDFVARRRCRRSSR